ncbi:MAG: DUF4340 domain-containing protein [Elusimicrobiota bacterium]|nr:DUF4340 domain-containing protein [Elusimicrobiota bacterium]
MKKYIIWTLVLIVLISYLILRNVITLYRPKQPLKNKEILQIEYTDRNKKNVIIKKEDNNWYVITANGKYKADVEKIKSLIDKLNKFELLELLSRKSDNYQEYDLSEDKAVKVKLSLKQKPLNFVIWLGKTGGFTYDEVYARINNKPEVYITRNLSKYEFQNNFYDFCDRTILKFSSEETNYVIARINNKNLEFKKELKDGTTVWFNVKTGKKLDITKIDNLLKNYSELISDIILEQNECDISKIKILTELKLYFADGTEIMLNLYDKITLATESSPVHPVKIKILTTKGAAIKSIGEEEYIYGLYEYRYKNIVDELTSL